MKAFKRWYILKSPTEYVMIMAPDKKKASEAFEEYYGLTDNIPIWEPKFKKIVKDKMKIVGGLSWHGKDTK